MHLVRLIKSASREANFIVLVSILLLAIKVFLLDRIPAFFSGGFEMGIIMEDIFASVVASYLFYLFVIHLKEFSDKETIQPYIHKHSLRVVGYCFTQVKAIGIAAGDNVSMANASVDAITEALKKIAPYSNAPIIMAATKKYANWFEYFIYYSERTKESIRRVLIQLPYADAKLVSLLTSIDDCAHFHNINYMRSIKVNDMNLANWAPNFSEYCKLCEQLHSYLKADSGKMK
ncbi:MAG: hypothetical protein HGA59_03230 [Chlorobiaceae bacterium]|nr:hypothetical protein [Chlorobiaceae bacterium]